MMEGQSVLPLIFAALMALSFFMYAILDGYDLGVGLLLPFADETQKDTMIASIGPFWDANETWLVLGVGLLLIAFPAAHNLVLGELYLPVVGLLIGLILRGVAFDFRAKVPVQRKWLWDRLFFVGSLLATTMQGYMLGKFVLGFADHVWAELFGLLSAVCVAAAYAFIGGSWLIMKCEGELQRRVVAWSRRSLWLMLLGIATVSLVNPLVSPDIFDKWFALPEAIVLWPIPALSGLTLVGTAVFLKRLQMHLAVDVDGPPPAAWVPFAAAVLVFMLCFQGLAYSFYPYVVPFQITIWEAAAADESLAFVAVGVAIVFPVILAYTAMSYRVFWGKSTDLTYH